MRRFDFGNFVSLLALSAPAYVFAQIPPTLDKIRATGQMTLAYRGSSIPFSCLDDQAQPVGFAHEICLRIADAVKKATARPDRVVSLQAVTSANRIRLLQNGTVDIECGSTTNNSERGKQVQFATNDFYTGTRFLVKPAPRSSRSTTSGARPSSRPPAPPTTKSFAT